MTLQGDLPKPLTPHSFLLRSNVFRCRRRSDLSFLATVLCQNRAAKREAGEVDNSNGREGILTKKTPSTAFPTMDFRRIAFRARDSPCLTENVCEKSAIS